MLQLHPALESLHCPFSNKGRRLDCKLPSIDRIDLSATKAEGWTVNPQSYHFVTLILDVENWKSLCMKRLRDRTTASKQVMDLVYMQGEVA